MLLGVSLYVFVGLLIALIQIFRNDCGVFVVIFTGIDGILLVVMFWPLLLIASIWPDAKKEVVLPERNAAPECEFSGKSAIVHSALHPSGKIDLEGSILDARADGQFIEKGTTVTIVRQELGAFVVR